jgi:hypothetical protein
MNHDRTSGDAIKSVAGELLIKAMRQLEPRQRVLVFARVALESPMGTLTGQFHLTAEQIEREVKQGLRLLRTAEGIEDLADIHRLGHLADFHEHIRRLGLERWFCEVCRRLLTHPKTGRPRKTCGEECSREKKRRDRASLKPPRTY